MSDWAPKLNPGVDLRQLPLSAEEGFVLSRLDGRTPLPQLPALTGLPLAQLEEVLSKLVGLNAVLPRSEPSAPVAEVATAERAEAQSLALDAASAEAVEESEEAVEPEEDLVRSGQHRALFERELHPLKAEERAQMAMTAPEPQLTALCYDPVPATIQAILHHPKVGLAHARLIARHHRNPVGLEAVAGRAAFAADAAVRRALVRNPQLPQGLFRRLFVNQRLLAQYKLSQDREVPEAARRGARDLLRARFSSATAEERVELIVKTEGRALASVGGLPVDGRTTSLLCARTVMSSLYVRNVARWGAAPPQLIGHLLKQEFVRRQPALRTLLLRHPNSPEKE